MFYQNLIKEILNGRDYQTRHIEAVMRANNGTLGDLSRKEFTEEVKLAILCIDELGLEMAEKIAKTYSL